MGVPTLESEAKDCVPLRTRSYQDAAAANTDRSEGGKWGPGLWASEPSAYIDCLCLTCCKFSAVSPVADPPA
jgi:hypothetical protein